MTQHFYNTRTNATYCGLDCLEGAIAETRESMDCEKCAIVDKVRGLNLEGLKLENLLKTLPGDSAILSELNATRALLRKRQAQLIEKV